MPYLTYDYVVGAWEQEEVAITVNLWYYTESEAVPSAKANELSAAIGIGGMQFLYRDARTASGYQQGHAYDLTADQMGDWAAAMGIEAVYIDKDTTIRNFKRDLMLGDIFYR